MEKENIEIIQDNGEIILNNIIDSSNEKAVLESVLFASGKPVNIQILSNAIKKDCDYTEKLLEQMYEERNKLNTGIEIKKVNDNYLMCTKKELGEKIENIFDEKKVPKLSNASMEVLSIIAYNQNISKTEIENIRGVSSDYLVNKLVDYGLVEEGTRKQMIGYPMGFVTTDKFLITFGIENLDQLPNLPTISEEDII